MRDVLYLERLDQAEALLKPLRVDVLRRLAEPRSCTEIGADLGHPPQKVYYHVKRLEEAGLVEQVAQRRVRGIHEGVYQATARSYWLSPRLAGTRHARDRLSLGHLLDLVEQVQSEVAALAGRLAAPVDEPPPQVPSLGISGEVRLSPRRRDAFLRDARSALEALLTKYGGAEGEPFRLAFACYPKDET